MMGIPGQPPSTFFQLATGCVQSVCVEDDRGVPSMIIDEIVRFISSTQFHCGCLKLLIANVCMMGTPGQPPLASPSWLDNGCVQSVLKTTVVSAP